MLKERRMIAQQVADSLFDAEAAIDAALAATAKLAGIMPSLRADANLSALIGQGAVERSIETISALGQARRAIVETHKELSVAQRDIGLRAVNFGGQTEKPVEGFAGRNLMPVARESQAA